ncbi:MAG: hypothetical protein ACRESV_02015 [Nevskiales bacterium]
MESAHKFVICVNNEGYAASLELRKLYEVLPDKAAAKHGQLRIIDESGDDYLYPKSYFASVELSALVADKILHAA